MSTTLTPAQVADALHGIKVPPQPQVLVDITMEQASTKPDLLRITELIRQDMGLSGAVLKVVNSNYFGLTNKIFSIEHAVSLLGLNSVINIINGLSVKSELSDETIVEMNRFWDHASDIALISAGTAKETGYPNVDEAYLLGLFHACGMPLMMQRYPDYLRVMEKAYSGNYVRIIDAENQFFHTNHAVIGYFIAKSWHLPAHICQLIAEQYNLQDIKKWHMSFDGHRKTLLAILKVAQHIGQSHIKLGGEQAMDVEWKAFGPDILEYLGLNAYDFDTLKQNILEHSA